MMFIAVQPVGNCMLSRMIILKTRAALVCEYGVDDRVGMVSLSISR